MGNGIDVDGVVPLDRRIGAVASRQHGVISRRQLIGLGASPDAIRWRLDAGRLISVHRGVYLVGHEAAPALAREMAAVLACRGRAVVSHRSAGAIWGLSEPRADAVEVTLHGSRSRSRPGIVVHSNRLDARDVRRFKHIPVTSPPRALLDLATVLEPDTLEAAVAEAHVRHLATSRELWRLIEGYGCRPGIPTLRMVLDAQGGPARTRSEAERRLLALVRAAGIPAPAANARVGRYEVDLLWRAERVAVEFDSWAFHSDRRAFERDRVRDADLQAQGYRVIRVTWRQLTRQPETVIARIGAALAHGSARAMPPEGRDGASSG